MPEQAYINSLVCTYGYKAKDITPSIAWRSEAWKEEALDDFLERTRDGHHQSDEHWNRFKGNVEETLVELIWAFPGA